MSSARRIAVMQPYFFPYGGYFGLMANVDEFVLFDCVQFVRRGRIHRTQVPGADGRLQWLTLPLAYSARDAAIRDIQFAPDARALLHERLAALPWYRGAAGPVAARMRAYLEQPLPAFNDFIEEGLRLAADLLDIPTRISRSSQLHIDPALRGQDRVLAIVRALGGTRYVNAPGGRALYDADTFARHGLELAFMPDYAGRHYAMLHSLMTEDPATMRDDVLAARPQLAAAGESRLEH